MSKALLALVCSPLLIAASCEKKSATADPGMVAALDHSGSGAKVAEADGPVDKTPLSGIDVGALSSERQDSFYKLVGSLSSPCGKAESLRKSFTADTSCKRAPFAVRYVKAMLEDEINEAQVREAYDNKYKPNDKPVKFDVSKAPHAGADDAPVKLYEFYDYGCPHCQAFKPMMDRVVQDEQGKVVEYFMQFPLEKHPDSKSAAQAAIAAAQQGKFKEMHDVLFEKTPLHDHEHVVGYAKELGLDIGKFEAAYSQAQAQVESDIRQGDAAGVDATPTLFFNDRKYEGPMSPKYIEMWIDEEVAVNR